MTYVCNATWTVTPGREEIVREALSCLSAAARAEPGNVYYQVYFHPVVPKVFRIFEVYDDADAFAAHLNGSPSVKAAPDIAVRELTDRSREIYETLDA